jgi:catechol 2,3-dioxygenase-like lactoylglutathione lyase family enzyme
VIAPALLCANAFAQSVSTKLDHVVIAVHDLEAAKRLYSGLGFSMLEGGRHPTGTENSAAPFNGSYVELITPYNASLPDGKQVAEHLKKGDGAIAAGLQIASAEKTARDLRAAGMNINGPTPGTIVRPGQKEPPPTGWWLITFGGSQFVDPNFPSRPVFLIQYAMRPVATEPAAPRPPPRPANPNSASSLSALLIAVNDPQKSIAWYENIGKASDREIALPEFGAAAKEIVLERCSILLLRATDSKDQQSVLVSPENAAGVWLEFQAAPPP